MKKEELRSLFAEKDIFNPDQKRYTKPTKIQEERAADGGEKWVYRDPLSYEEVESGVAGALRYKRYWLYPSTETVDWYDTIVERQAMIDAFPEYIESGGGVRFMHENDPIGHVFPGDYEIREKGVYVGLSIPEYETRIFQRIAYKILTGASLGWNSVEIKWPEGPNDKVRFTKIKIAEITLCDTRATKGTEIQEERSISINDEISLFQRFLRWIKGQNRSIAGTLPAEPQEDDMLTPEQFKEFMDKQQTRDAAILGELGKIAEKIAPKHADPPKQEPTIEQRIADAVTAATKSLMEEITTLKRSITTEEPLSLDLENFEKIQKQMETEIENRNKTGPTVNERLSFIRTANGSLTAEALLEEV